MSDRAKTASAGDPGWRIVPLGDRALLVEFGHQVDPAINARALAFAQALLRTPLAGVSDVVPAFTTVALHYRPEAIGTDGSPYEQLRSQVQARLAQGIEPEPGAARRVEVPVCYGGESGPDLEEVARSCGLPPEEVIERHLASPHVVYMLGFAPGFPYLGGLDPRLAVPRRSTPRTVVPAGSVAIARDQTAIYPLATPGGWNLIGRTPLRLFDPSAQTPCLLQPGDRVRFVPITAEALRAQDANS